ncbi:retrotransposon protein, putative, ty1-copia subclass [Tanacetum coccineum]
MITELQKMYGKPPGVELQELVNMFHSCKQAEGQSVSDHVLLMKSYLDQLATLNYAFPDKVIKRDKQQIVGAPLQPHVLAIKVVRVRRIKARAVEKDGQCHHCKEEGHWKRNCPLYLAELMKKKKTGGQNVASTSSDFLEKDFILQKESGRNVELDDEDILPSENTSEHPIEEESLAPMSLRRGCCSVVDRLGDLNEPANYKAALSDLEFEKWLETFSPVAGIRAIRILIAIAAYYDYEIWQMDVKTAFLNGFLEEEIYMEQPEGFIDPNHPREAAFILGIKIYRDRSRRLIGLSQNAYLDKILKRYRMDNSKRGSIPMQVDLHLNKSQCATTSAEMKRMQNVPYASAVGSIMYAVRNTKDTFLVYGGNPEAELQVKCYCDAGFETDRDDTKSQTGYVFVLNGGAVVWKSSKQSTTAQHATEAEYIAASEAAKEAVWIRKFIDELGVVPSNDYPIKMNCDNSAAIIIAKESGIQKGARHFQRKYHYVRECIKTGEIDIVKVHTDENLADPFTKALAGPKLTRHARSMGLRPASSFM